MPYRWSFPCHRPVQPDADTMSLPSPTSAPDYDSWLKVRFGYVRSLRKQTKCILLLMAMIEALKHGPCELVYAGRNGFAAPGAEDYGLAYTVGYMLSYVYVCIFMIVFVPLFSWWIPKTSSDPENPDMTMKIASFLKKLNMVLLPISIACCGISYLVSLIQLFVYVDARPINSLRLPRNTRKNWAVRGLLVAGIVGALAFGYGALHVLEMMELARVKTVEYYVILVPIQTNLGILIGSKVQMKIEKRAAMKGVVKLIMAEAEHVKIVDEKAPLIEV